MMYKKEKKEHNISEFDKFKVLLVMKKPRSPHTLTFLTNDPEGWFINVVEYRTTSGRIMNDSYIIEKDMPHFIIWYEGMGWVKQT